MPLRPFLVHHDDASRDARAKKKIGRQSDYTFDIALSDNVLADVSLGIATEQHTMRQNHRAFAGAFQAGQDVQQEGIIAILVGRYAIGKAVVQVVRRV